MQIQLMLQKLIKCVDASSFITQFPSMWLNEYSQKRVDCNSIFECLRCDAQMKSSWYKIWLKQEHKPMQEDKRRDREMKVSR